MTIPRCFFRSGAPHAPLSQWRVDPAAGRSLPPKGETPQNHSNEECSRELDGGRRGRLRRIFRSLGGGRRADRLGRLGSLGRLELRLQRADALRKRVQRRRRHRAALDQLERPLPELAVRLGELAPRLQLACGLLRLDRRLLGGRLHLLQESHLSPFCSLTPYSPRSSSILA